MAKKKKVKKQDAREVILNLLTTKAALKQDIIEKALLPIQRMLALN